MQNERIVNVQWDENTTNIKLRPVRLQVLCEDSPGEVVETHTMLHIQHDLFFSTHIDFITCVGECNLPRRAS